MDKPICIITMGDPAGIGPEVIIKTLFSDRAQSDARMVVIGYPEPFVRDTKKLGIKLDINEITYPEELNPATNTINLIIPDNTITCPTIYGEVNADCGRAAGRCVEHATKLAMDKKADAVVTAPINKESFNLGGYNFPGHTEILRYLTGASDVAMLLTHGNFRVAHVVTHTAISSVANKIYRGRIVRVAALMNETLNILGIEKPHLAISGLNPHAGEAGMFGKKEIEEIIPAVEELKEMGIDVTGPMSPDTVFAKAYSGEFDGVVAMYHDQGHIALKIVAFRFKEEGSQVCGVNTALGLPIIRTSVDHGTAFDIAGKGKASPHSMIEAVEMASKLAIGKKARQKS
ncbi:MAG: 4-hydroxythreonine-4-phosphate dehydrogenase PdxA [Candidatus Latescibacteria bacterium]|nr:4-hydroxythreonine-4-phosphate dehydrogenase PdxA [Candidatus Latescibacterota bacterium]